MMRIQSHFHAEKKSEYFPLSTVSDYAQRLCVGAIYECNRDYRFSKRIDTHCRSVGT